MRLCLLIILIVSILLHISYASEINNKVEELKNEVNLELIPDTGNKIKEVGNDYDLEVENKVDQIEISENSYEFREISFEDNLKNLINKIVSLSNSDQDEDISNLLHFVFGNSGTESVNKQQMETRKQSKFQQLKEYFESYDEIIKSHKFEIDQRKVREISHDFAQVYSKVFHLNEKERVQYEENVKTFINNVVRKLLSSFGLSEYKSMYLSEDAEKDRHQITQHTEASDYHYTSPELQQNLAKVTSVTDKNIEAFSKIIVELSENNSKFLDGIMEKLNIKNESIQQKQANISSILKASLRVLYSFYHNLYDGKKSGQDDLLDEQINNIQKSFKLPTWVTETTIQDFGNLLNAEELFNPRTVIALSRLFVPDSQPISKFEKEQLTHQFIDLGYSILYGRAEKYQEFSLKGEKVSESNIDNALLNRIINIADETQKLSEENSSKGSLIRASRLLFSLFEIRENYDEWIDDDNSNQDIEIVNEPIVNTPDEIQPQKDVEQQQEQEQEQQEEEPTSNIEYISYRVNKLIKDNPNIEDGDEMKRNENVFRILYNIYLHYYGMEEENQLESNRNINSKSNKMVEKEDEEVAFIREILPSLSEKDVMEILEEIDRVAQQLGYTSRDVDEFEEEGASEYEEYKQENPRDLSMFEYPEEE